METRGPFNSKVPIFKLVKRNEANKNGVGGGETAGTVRNTTGRKKSESHEEGENKRVGERGAMSN